jgi:Flp pilus assembly pilin Flp
MSPYMRDDSGAALVEYSMLISLIVAVAFLSVQAFGGSVLGLIQTALDSMP